MPELNHRMHNFFFLFFLLKDKGDSLLSRILYKFKLNFDISAKQAVLAQSQMLTAWELHRSIKLPVAALLNQFKTIPNQLTRHFDLLYIHQGIDRIPVDVSFAPLFSQPSRIST